MSEESGVVLRWGMMESCLGVWMFVKMNLRSEREHLCAPGTLTSTSLLCPCAPSYPHPLPYFLILLLLFSHFDFSSSLLLLPWYLLFFSEAWNRVHLRVCVCALVYLPERLCDLFFICLNLERVNVFMRACIFSGASLFWKYARGCVPAWTNHFACLCLWGKECCAQWVKSVQTGTSPAGEL